MKLNSQEKTLMKSLEQPVFPKMKTLDFSGNTTKSYLHYVGALSAAEKVLGKLTEDQQDGITVIIAATPNGRFAPVFKLRQNVLYLAISIAGCGHHVIG